MKVASFRLALLLLLLLVSPGVAGQDLNFRPPPGWTPGNVQQARDQMLMEFVKTGETVENWTELLTVQQFPRSSGSPREFYDQIRARRDTRCPGAAEWRIVAEEAESVLYEWSTSGPCNGQPAQWEIARLIFAWQTGYRVAYATRAQPTAEARSTWTDWVRGVSLGRTGAPDGAQTPTVVAKLLAERDAVVELPAKGKVSRKIRLDDEAFAMPGGPSRAVLLRLPEYRAPYVLTVKSFLYKKAMSLTAKIFVPTTVLLDGNYQVTRTVPEAGLEPKGQGMTKGPSYQATISVADAQKDERFVLVYTQGAAVDDPVRVLNLPLGLRARKSADGDIEVETKPSK